VNFLIAPRMKTCFCHLTVVWCTLAEERLAASTQSTHHWKVHLVLTIRWSLTIRVYLHSFSSETREMLRNCKRIWPYSSSRSSTVIDLGVNGKPICDFLLVINCNFSRICNSFRDILS